MELIKISPDRVQIKSSNQQLSDIRINSAILLQDVKSGVSVVCLVESISRREEDEQFDFDGNLLVSEPASTIECGIIGSLVDGKFRKSVDQYPC